MAQKQCNNCGAYLDPEERCDCRKTNPREPDEIILIVGPHGRGKRILPFKNK